MNLFLKHALRTLEQFAFVSEDAELLGLRANLLQLSRKFHQIVRQT